MLQVANAEEFSEDNPCRCGATEPHTITARCMLPDRILPREKINDQRFGQLLLNALQDAGHLKQESWDNMVTHTTNMEYKVTGKDLFYIENDELETILQEYLDGSDTA